MNPRRTGEAAPAAFRTVRDSLPKKFGKSRLQHAKLGKNESVPIGSKDLGILSHRMRLWRRLQDIEKPRRDFIRGAGKRMLL